jgi:hypothetical protein
MGGLGVLDVFANGKLIFSYKEQGRMPSDQEILDLLSATPRKQVSSALEGYRS